ncbi:MAG TPA: hypothetical protein VFG83_06315, partial [Kofleriaceae bacterium]|nr:hypothetical protein [Kofleriaceae bacterium]
MKVALAAFLASVTGCVAPLDTSEVSQQAKVCADGPVVHGIDVSYWQTDINWNQVAQDDVHYAFIRVNHGLTGDGKNSGVDVNFARN